LSTEGDHITLVNVMKSYTQEVEAIEGSEVGADRKKIDKKMRSWCAQNFINGRSLRRSLDIRRYAFVYCYLVHTRQVIPVYAGYCTSSPF
jgi:hypothetical protein